MKKIVAFGASSSSKSINKDLALFAVSQIENIEEIILDLNDFEMPIYSTDRQKENGIPDLAFKFNEILKNSDGIIISFAEHNSSYAAAFKNIFDWFSVIDKPLWHNKPMFLLATSDGSRGAKTILEIAHNTISRKNPNKIPVFSLPSFYENFKDNGIVNKKLLDEFTRALKVFISNLN